MAALAAVMTDKGAGAIATIQLFGESAEGIIGKVFRPAGRRPQNFGNGKILLGTIAERERIIDQVTIGCEGDKTFAIHCHGNPLIVGDIVKLLETCGATVVSAEQVLYAILSQDKTLSSVAIEAKLILPKVRTLEGSRIILNQIESGLNKAARRWATQAGEKELEQVRAEAAQILAVSRVARLTIFGCRIVLAGPPNTGKSTLLNRLCGREKAIVSDISGTTRDWVTADCRIGPLSAELIDTAGIAEEIAASAADAESQKRAAEMLSQADLVLLVLDNSGTNAQLTECLVEKMPARKILAVLNKSDLPAKFRPERLPKSLGSPALISAKSGDGIDALCDKICSALSVHHIEPDRPVCFTARQAMLVEQIAAASSPGSVSRLASELLNGRIVV